MKPYYEDQHITIYNEDCRHVLPQIQNIGLCLTSPPYLNQRDYTLSSFDWYSVVPSALSSVQLAERGQMLVNLGVVHQNGEVVPYWNELAKRLQSEGFKFFGQYVWDQGFGLPGDWNGRLAPSCELLFHFNRQARQINKIVKCSKAGHNPSTTGLRGKDGQVKTKAYSCIQDIKIPDSVIRIMREQNRTDLAASHPARFPKAFADFLIRAFGHPGDIVLDPFMGSGTTLYAAKELQYRCIGIEIEERYCEMAAIRCSQENLFGAPELAEAEQTSTNTPMAGGVPPQICEAQTSP